MSISDTNKFKKTTMVAATSIAAMAINNTVHAEDVKPVSENTTTATSTVKEETVKTVEGVSVSNGVAIVATTPTEATVTEAETIKADADKAVGAQEAEVKTATTSNTEAETAEKVAFEELKKAEDLKASATPEVIEKTNTEIKTTEETIVAKEQGIKAVTTSIVETTTVKEGQDSELKKAQDATLKQADNVTKATEAVTEAEKALAGTGLTEALAEKEMATNNLAEKQMLEEGVRDEFEAAKRANEEIMAELEMANLTKEMDSATLADSTHALETATADSKSKETKLNEASAELERAKANLENTRLLETIVKRDEAQTELDLAKEKQDAAKQELNTARANDAENAALIAELEATKTQQEDALSEATANLTKVQNEAKESLDAKEQADVTVAKLESQLNALKNLTVPQLTPEIIQAYKDFLADDSEDNLNRLDSLFNNWYKNSQFDPGFIMSYYSPETGKVTKRSNPNFNMIHPIDDTVIDPNNLTSEQLTALSHYYTFLANQLQKQVWGTQSFVVSKDSVKAIKNIAENYKNENKTFWTGHSYDALKNDKVDNISSKSENMSTLMSAGEFNYKKPDTTTTTMTQLYYEVLENVVGFMAKDKDSDFGHMINLLGRTSAMEKLYLGASPSLTSNKTGRLHYVAFNGTNQTEVPSPFNLTVAEANLAGAKSRQAEATHYNEAKQAELTEAQAQKQTAERSLEETVTELTKAKAYQNQSPEAEAKYNATVLDTEKAQEKLDQLNKQLEALNKSEAEKQAAYQTAKQVYDKVKAENDDSKVKLDKAQENYNKAQKQLDATIATINNLEATLRENDKVADKLAQATTARKEAEERLNKAVKTVETLSASSDEKAQRLQETKAALAKEEDKLKTLKEAEQEHVKQVEKMQQKINALTKKKEELEKELTNLKETLNTTKVRLNNLLNADKVLEEAKAKHAKANAHHKDTLKALTKAQDRLNVLLRIQRDATAQYNALKDAYLASLPKESGISKPSKTSSITDMMKELELKKSDTTIKDNNVSPLSTQHSEKIQNKPQAYSRLQKHHVLPKTNSEQSVLAMTVGAILSSIGLMGLRRRR